MSMKKCNISVSTAKKGEVLQAVGVGNCQITVLTVGGELTKLVLHDVLYVPEARRNLLSTSKLSQDRFQVVFPSRDSIFSPGIYNCHKNKSSVEYSIPNAHVGNLFHVHTCAEAEIKRHDRAENKWILWHHRLRRQLCGICCLTRFNKWSTAVRDLMIFRVSQCHTTC